MGEVCIIGISDVMLPKSFNTDSDLFNFARSTIRHRPFLSEKLSPNRKQLLFARRGPQPRRLGLAMGLPSVFKAYTTYSTNNLSYPQRMWIRNSQIYN